MSKVRSLILSVAVLATMLTVPVAAEASVAAQASSIKYYGQCRKGTYSWGGWYSSFVFYNAQANGWSCSW